MACPTADVVPYVALKQTHWGTHSLTMAIRALLEFALEDSLNQRFMLLSESDVPLYPATVVWLQLINEQQSRIRACPGPLVSSAYSQFPLAQQRASSRLIYITNLVLQAKSQPSRWSGSLQESTVGVHHWRHSDAWFCLIRRHAEAISDDTEVVREFAENCEHLGGDATRYVPLEAHSYL